MSGSVRRRHSKWDHKNSEDLPQTLHDRGPLRRHREPSPDKGLRRHDSHIKERVFTSDKERNSSRMSPGLNERNNQHRSRSPRNGWGRSHRSSRSRSRSPGHHLRREPASNDKNRSRSRVSAQICRDFAVGRCRRGDHCQFLHQNDQTYDRRRPSEYSPPYDWEGRNQRTGRSRSSPLETKFYDSRTEKSMHVCKEFLKGKCRGGTSCRYVHHETGAGAFEKEPIDDVRRDVGRDRDRVWDMDNGCTTRDTSHRNYDHEPSDMSDRVRDRDRDKDRERDNDCRSRDTYRNHDPEPRKRGETFCKYFAAGNCRSGNHCRFSHEVQQKFSPERRSQDDRRGTDQKLESGHVWDGPRWSDVPPVSNVPPLQGWIEDKKEVTVAAEQVPATKPADDSWSHDRLAVKDSWIAPPTTDEIPTQAENSSLQWKTENNVLDMGLSSSRGAEIISDGVETSPRNISFGPGQQDAISFTKYEKPYLGGFTDHKLYNDAFIVQNSNHLEDKQTWYHGEGKNVIVNKDSSSILQSPTLNTTTYQGFSQNQLGANEHTSSRSPAGQRQVHLQPSEGSRIQQSHVPSVFTNASAANGPHLTDATSGYISATATSPAGQVQTPFSLQPSEGGKMQESLGPSVFLNTAATDRPHFMYASSSGNASAIATSPAVHGQTQFSFPSNGGRVEESVDRSIMMNTTAADGPHLVNATSFGHPSAVDADIGSVSSQQLVQLSQLSASLAQLMENRQKLPPLSSSITPLVMSKLADAVVSVPPASRFITQPNQDLELSKQLLYDPICDSMEPKVHNSGDLMLPSDVEQKSAIFELNNEGDKANQLVPVATSKGDDNLEKAVEQSSQVPVNKPSEDMPVEDGADDDKKSKDTKAIRPFKFALAEFVKELLKPSWKDGQVNKDSYKVIVKKVVDKIIETQGLQIPQSKEKIDQYLSSSKPKIEKLVQAYVGRYQKK